MKLSRLFVLSALWLTGLGVNAADLTDQRTAPEEPDWIVDVSTLDTSKPQTFEVGVPYVLYNVGSELFYYRGNAWTTQATGSAENALPVRFVLPSGKSLADKQLYLRDFDDRPNEMKWRTAFVTSDGTVNGVYGDGTIAMFIDNNDGTTALMWVEPKEGEANVYRLSISESNTNAQPEGLYVGIDPAGPGVSGGADGTCIMPKLSADDANVDWIFLALPSEMANYFKLLDIYNKAEELKKLIGKAEAQGGVDISAAVNAYNNLDATLEELQAAYDALEKNMKDNTFTGFTPGTVLNVSGLINNPTFDGNDLSGWDGSGWGAYGPKENAERFSMNFDTYQDIAGLKAGVYVAGVNAFYRAGNSAAAYENYKAQNDDSKNAKFYVSTGEEEFTADVVSPYEGAPTSQQGKGSESSAKDADTGITYYIPNNMEAAEYYMHSLGLYKNNIFFETSANQMRIGLKKESTITDDWVICDDFSLIYCGEGAQAYQAYVEYYKTLFPDYTELRVDAEDPFTSTSGLNVSDCVLDAFNAVSVSASDESSARAAMDALDEAFDEVRTNISLWAEFLNTAKKAVAVRNDDSLDQSDDLVAEVGDWGVALAAEEWNAREMNNDQLRARIDEMEEKIKEAKTKYVVTGDERPVTHLLTNPDFEDGTNGWTIERVSGGNVVHGGTATNKCFEGWNNANFNIYQVVKDAPEGVYRIEVQGFYRYGRTAYADYLAQSVEYVKPGGAPVFVYMNKKATPFTNIYGDPKQITDESFYKTDSSDYTSETNEEEGVTYYFPNGMASAAVAFSDGMYKQSAYGVIRAGQDMQIGVKGNSSQLDDSWSIWDNFKLFNCGKDQTVLNEILPEEIEKANNLLTDEEGAARPMGKSVVTALEAAIAKAEAAVGKSGDEMFTALFVLLDAEDGVEASVELFAKLTAANDKLMNAIESYSDAPAADEASALYQKILDNVAQNKYENEDVEGLLEEISAMMTKLRLPAGYEEANALNPVDVTSIIINPEFDGDGAGNNSIEGWNVTSYKYGEGEDNINAMGLEFWQVTIDLNQTISGAPNGWYVVQVSAFERTETPTYLYASSAGKGYQKELEKKADTDEFTGVKDATDAFAMGSYVNQVKVKVTDGKLTIGLDKKENATNDWVVCDDWKLTYYGQDEPEVECDVLGGMPGDVNSDETVDVADISSIISVMAGTASYPNADVNGDGTVDVADISSVITIMAAAARAQGIFIDVEE